MLETIYILDCDQTLAGLIARTLRSQDFYCELVPPETAAQTLRGRNAKGIVIAAENGGFVCGIHGGDPLVPSYGIAAFQAIGIPILLFLCSCGRWPR